MLVLLPGLLCDAALWTPLRQHLTHPHTATLVPDLTLDDTLPAMAARVLAQAPPHFNLAGLSMGGYLAFEILRQQPHRITRLCLIATSAAPDDADHARRRRALIGIVRRNPRFLGLTPRTVPELLHPARLADPILVAEVIAMARRTGRDAFLRQQQAIAARPDSRPMLPAIAIPTTIIVGEADRITPPAHAQSMAAAIPHATLHVLPGCAHLPPLERPAPVAHAMQTWLDTPAPA